MNRIGLVVLGSALLLGACSASNAEPVEQSAAPVAVRLAAVEEQELAQPITASGTVAAKEELTLAFKNGGVVAHVAVDAGQRVHAGQTLARLELREIDAGLSRAESAAERAERELVRARRLYRDSVIALAQLQDAETAAQVARADLDAARFNHRYAVIVAPADGIVLRRFAEPGELVAAGAPILAVGSRARGSVLRVGLADRDAVRVRRGDAASVHFDALPERTFAGRVAEIGAAVDAGTGTVVVEVSLADASELFSGMVGTAVIQPASATRVQLIPVEAVLEADRSNGTTFVLGADGEHVERRVVRVARIAGDRVIITHGLEGARHVVTDGAAYLSHGAKVKVVP